MKITAVATWLLLAWACLVRGEGVRVHQASEQTFPPVGLDGDWLTVGGERFLVVGVGYEVGSRPGRVPWDRDFRPELLRRDFERIGAAGFNTIRTWNPLTDEELAIAAEHGLWVIQGLWYDTRADFSDPVFQKKTLAEVEKVVLRSSKHPNILFYLLGNEPHAHSVHKTGLDEVAAFCRKLVATAHRCDSKGPVSYSNCVITDFLVPDMWDLTAHNTYPYSPVTIDKALGYRAYIETIKERFAESKPLIITEFGLSVEVWAPKGNAVRARIDAGTWVALSRRGPWWRGELSVTNLPTGLHTVHTEMKDDKAEWRSPKQATVRIAPERDAGPRFTVMFKDLPETCKGNTRMPVTILVRDHDGKPAGERRVSIARFRHTGWNEFHTSATTGPEGVAIAHVPVAPQPGIISIAAAVEGDIPERNGTGWKQGRCKRYTDYQHITVVR